MGRYNLFTQNIDETVKMIEEVFKNFEAADTKDQDRFVPVLISRPGVGKSATVSKMAKRMGYDLIDLNLATITPEDIIGLGAREKIDGKWKTMPAIPLWVDRALAGNCILFVDEFNNTTADVLAGFQKMFSDFTLDGNDLPKTTHIIGACNPPGSDALFAAKKLSGAFRRRLCMIPVIDDFEYTMKKHNFTIPRSYMEFNYDDIVSYCEYDEISSAVIDNVFNISKYTGVSDFEKVVLTNGFGQRALIFARDMELISDDLMTRSKIIEGEGVSESEWLKSPDDNAPEYDQIIWGQARIVRSASYSRSKKFLSQIKNSKVYKEVYETLEDQFPDELAADESPLPSER